MSDLSQDAFLASAVGTVPYHQTFKGDKCKARPKDSSQDTRSAMEDLQQCFGIFLLHLLKHMLKCKANRIMVLTLFYI